MTHWPPWRDVARRYKAREMGVLRRRYGGRHEWWDPAGMHSMEFWGRHEWWNSAGMYSMEFGFYVIHDDSLEQLRYGGRIPSVSPLLLPLRL